MNRRAFLMLALPLLVTAGAASQTTMRDYAYELMLHENYRAALGVYEKLLQETPGDGHLMDEYAYCLLKNRKYGKAVRAYKKAAELFAASDEEWAAEFRTDALVMCGEVYLTQKKPKKAREQFQSVYDENPAEQNVLLGIVASYLRLEYTEEAASFLEQNIRSHGDMPEALALLYQYWAQCQYALGNPERATLALQYARENYLKAGIVPPDEELDRLYALFTDSY